MSNSDRNSTAVQELALRQSGMLDQPEEWAAPAAPAAPAAHPVSGVAMLWHVWRRHWVAAILCGLPLAALAAWGVWEGYGPTYESTALLRVAMHPEEIIQRANPYSQALGRSEFEIFRSTQQQLIRSQMVLTAALRREKVKRFGLDDRYAAPVTWLQDRLKVAFPGDGEIMRVSLVRPDPEESTELVAAVVEAYLNDVVNVDRKQRNDRRVELDRVYGDRETKLRDARTRLRNLAESVGTSDKKGISLKQQIALEQFAGFQRELMRTQFELRHAKGELDGYRAQIEAIADMRISPYELDIHARNNPQYIKLAEELAWARMDYAKQGAHLREGNNSSRYIDRFKADKEMLQAEFDELTQELIEGVRGMKRSEVERDRLKKEAEVASLSEQEVELAREVVKKKEEAEKLSGSSVDLDMILTEIEHFESVLKGVSEERDRLNVELRSPSRVTPVQAADEPKSESLPGIRIALAIVAALAAFCLPLGLLFLRDRGAQYLNSSQDVSRGLGLAVIGTVPVIPARAMRRLGSSARHNRWQGRLIEAVDSIAAHVYRRATMEETRLVLVTSALGGECKTTLATQLAWSLARSGRRTLLVDFDLRRPALDTVFRLPREPGVADALRGAQDIGAMIHPTPAENLSMMPAGQWDRQVMAALSNGGGDALLKELRTRFEFVVVDSAPVLPVADTRFLTPHVDAVIVSALRDTSQMPKVQEACDILKAFGARSVEVVVTGRGTSGYER